MSFLINKSFRVINLMHRQQQRVCLQHIQQRLFSDKTDNVPTSTEEGVAKSETENKSDKLGGFAKAFEKFSKPWEEAKPVIENLSFSKLLRESKFIDLGDAKGKIVSGKIVQVVGDDLYIDFGWKFNCVCTRPDRNGKDYVRGAKVRLRVNELELSSRFLGSEKDLTILEADCTLIGLITSPARSQLETRKATRN